MEQEVEEVEPGVGIELDACSVILHKENGAENPNLHPYRFMVSETIANNLGRQRRTHSMFLWTNSPCNIESEELAL